MRSVIVLTPSSRVPRVPWYPGTGGGIPPLRRALHRRRNLLRVTVTAVSGRGPGNVKLNFSINLSEITRCWYPG
eukprot:2056328-Rhodomonas_salina.1